MDLLTREKQSVSVLCNSVNYSLFLGHSLTFCNVYMYLRLLFLFTDHDSPGINNFSVYIL